MSLFLHRVRVKHGSSDGYPVEELRTWGRLPKVKSCQWNRAFQLRAAAQC
jgi:hypothetical protein